MVDVIRLHGDPHHQTQTLLPWYANGTLGAGEAAAVEAHLNDCAECQGDLKAEQALASAVAGLPSDEARGWAALRERVAVAPPHRGSVRFDGVRGFLHRPVTVGAALAAQAAMLILVVGVAWTSSLPTRPAYRALGAAPAAASGNIVVMFEPTASEQQLRAALVQSGARVVDGPTASDAFVLRVPAEARARALARLRANAHVALAEPIDPDTPR